jgi:hypothetical protein
MAKLRRFKQTKSFKDRLTAFARTPVMRQPNYPQVRSATTCYVRLGRPTRRRMWKTGPILPGCNRVPRRRLWRSNQSTLSCSSS